jgi:hypothetical protein
MVKTGIWKHLIRQSFYHLRKRHNDEELNFDYKDIK